MTNSWDSADKHHNSSQPYDTVLLKGYIRSRQDLYMGSIAHTTMTTKIDPHKTKEQYCRWKERINGRIPEISKENSEIILKYLKDMELGINVAISNKKGSRGFTRLNSLRNRIIFLSKHFTKKYKKNLIEMTETEVCEFFNQMRQGIIKKENGENYKSVQDYVKVFKAFWHWYQRISYNKGKEIKDITLYLDATGEKPEWVYLTEEQVKQLVDNAKPRYKILIMFLFDTGIRAPTELVNIRVSDLYDDCKELMIRDEISKTFGRKIKLMICSSMLKEYIKANNLKLDDQLFPIHPYTTNCYLKRLAKRVLGDSKSPAGQPYSKLTMYDFRHCSCCYWLPRYKSESALKYRFGWKKSDKIHYYSEMLGMRDTITEEDILIDLTKTEIEKRLVQTENKYKILAEENEQMRTQMKKIYGLVKNLNEYKKIIYEI